MEWYQPIHRRFAKYCDSMAYGVVDPKDLVQETVLLVLQKWDSVRKKESLLAFMVGVATNQLRMHQRKMKRQTRMECEKEALRRMEAKTQNAEVAFDIHLLHLAMEKLTEKERASLTMFEISGFSIREVAQALGEGESAVKTRLSRARHKLKAMLEDGEAPSVIHPTAKTDLVSGRLSPAISSTLSVLFLL